MTKMNKVLIDSSVWIDYLRKGRSSVVEPVDLLLDEDRAALWGMIELEIFQGIRGNEHPKIQDLFQALYFIESKREDYITAGLMLNQLRVKGVTIPSSDCLIAAQCIRCDIPLFTLDNDFKQIHSLKKYLG